MDVRDGELVVGRQYLVADRRGRGLPVARGGGDRECVAAGGGGVDRSAIRHRADARRQRRPVRALSACVARGDELSPGVASAARRCRDRGRGRGRDLEVDRRGTGLTVPTKRGDRIRMSSERRRVERSTRPRRAARVGAALQARAITPLSAREARRYLLSQRERLTIGRRRDRRCRRSRDRVVDRGDRGLAILAGCGDRIPVSSERRRVERSTRPRRAARVGAALQARAITPLSAREARRYLLSQRERLTIGRRRDRRRRRSRDRVGDARGPGLIVLRGRGDGVGVGPDRRGVKRPGRPRGAV